MQRVAGSGKLLDLLTLIDKLKSDGNLDKAGGRSAVAALLDEIPSLGLWDHYLGIMREKYQLRELIRECTNIVASAYDSPESAQTLADSACETLGRVADCVQSRDDMPTMRERALDAVDRYQQAFDRGELQGLSTGLSRLDAMTGGFLDSDLIVIGARPSFGKTALMTQIAGQISIVDKLPVGMFSGEMSGDALTDRFFSQLAEVNLRDLGGGKFTKRDFDRLMLQAKRIAGSNMAIDDRAGLTIGEIRRAGRRMKAKQGVKIIFLDYLQRFRADTAKENSDERSRYGAVVGGLKDMAKELRIPVVALVQLARRADDKFAYQINQGDVEGCSKIEQDADFMGFLGRTENDEETPDMFRDLDLNIAKQRNGPTGLISLRFRKSHTLFSEKATI
jgi:replicative DNA helicase